MVYHVTILAGKMIETKASHDTQRLFHDLSRAVEYCHYYHKEKKDSKTKQKTKQNKGKKGRKKTKQKLKEKKEKEKEKKTLTPTPTSTPAPTPSPRFTDTLYFDISITSFGSRYVLIHFATLIGVKSETDVPYSNNNN